jgi:DNA-directed RNA polymerase specialized sigma24 family protein
MDDENFKEIFVDFNDPDNEYLLRDYRDWPRTQQTGETKAEFIQRLKQLEENLQKEEELAGILRNLIQEHLSTKQKEAIVLLLMGKTYEEIAEILNINVRAAWERINGDAKNRGGVINKLKKVVRKKGLKP